MTSFILIIQTPEQGREEALLLCKEHEIDSFDTTILTPTSTKEGGSSSLKIKEVHTMLEKASLKPLKSKTKAVVLLQSELLTVPAQNALLKLLEEPPEHTILILTTNNLDALLPTIRSRCSIIDKRGTETELTEDELKTLRIQAGLLFTQPVGDALKMAEQLAKKKEETTRWLEQMITFLREKMLSDIKKDSSQRKEAKALPQFIKTYTYITTTNANPRLLLESLFLKMQQI